MIRQILLQIAARYVLPKTCGGQERPVIFFDNGNGDDLVSTSKYHQSLDCRSCMPRLKAFVEGQLRKEQKIHDCQVGGSQQHHKAFLKSVWG